MTETVEETLIALKQHYRGALEMAGVEFVKNPSALNFTSLQHAMLGHQLAYQLNVKYEHRRMESKRVIDILGLDPYKWTADAICVAMYKKTAQQICRDYS